MAQQWISRAARIPSPQQWTNTSHFLFDVRHSGVASRQITTCFFLVASLKSSASLARRSYVYSTSSSECVTAPMVEPDAVAEYSVNIAHAWSRSNCAVPQQLVHLADG